MNAFGLAREHCTQPLAVRSLAGNERSTGSRAAPVAVGRCFPCAVFTDGINCGRCLSVLYDADITADYRIFGDRALHGQTREDRRTVELACRRIDYAVSGDTVDRIDDDILAGKYGALILIRVDGGANALVRHEYYLAGIGCAYRLVCIAVFPACIKERYGHVILGIYHGDLTVIFEDIEAAAPGADAVDRHIRNGLILDCGVDKAVAGVIYVALSVCCDESRLGRIEKGYLPFCRYLRLCNDAVCYREHRSVLICCGKHLAGRSRHGALAAHIKVRTGREQAEIPSVCSVIDIALRSGRIDAVISRFDTCDKLAAGSLQRSFLRIGTDVADDIAVFGKGRIGIVVAYDVQDLNACDKAFCVFEQFDRTEPCRFISRAGTRISLGHRAILIYGQDPDKVACHLIAFYALRLDGFGFEVDGAAVNGSYDERQIIRRHLKGRIRDQIDIRNSLQINSRASESIIRINRRCS